MPIRYGITMNTYRKQNMFAERENFDVLKMKLSEIADSKGWKVSHLRTINSGNGVSCQVEVTADVSPYSVQSTLRRLSAGHLKQAIPAFQTATPSVWESDCELYTLDGGSKSN